MPKLSFPKITKGNAITALLKLYRQEPEFMKELNEIREPYMQVLKKFTQDAVIYFKKHKLSPAEYYNAVIDWYKGHKAQDPFPIKEFQYLSQLQPYFDQLSKLADRWKLKASWAVISLFIFDLIDCLKELRMPSEIDIALGDLEAIYPWSPPSPPLEIKVSSWDIIVLGRKPIQAEIASKLKVYEDEVKAKGLHEYPFAQNVHARLWFEHYMHVKTYKELESEYPSAGQESIKRAVWKFTKMLGISVK
jgi:hypothetical protein